MKNLENILKDMQMEGIRENKLRYTEDELPASAAKLPDGISKDKFIAMKYFDGSITEAEHNDWKAMHGTDVQLHKEIEIYDMIFELKRRGTNCANGWVIDKDWIGRSLELYFGLKKRLENESKEGLGYKNLFEKLFALWYCNCGDVNLKQLALTSYDKYSDIKSYVDKQEKEIKSMFMSHIEGMSGYDEKFGECCKQVEKQIKDRHLQSGEKDWIMQRFGG